MQRCDVQAEQLIAYLDGYLSKPESQEMSAHLGSCIVCQYSVSAFHETNDLLRVAPPMINLADARAAISTRLQAEIAGELRRKPTRGLLAVLTLLVVLGVAGTASSEAGFSFHRFLHIGPVAVERATETGRQPNVPGGAAAVPSPVQGVGFLPVEPARLPLSLELAQRALLDSSRLELLYRNPDGIAILLIELPVETSSIALSPVGTQTTVQVGNLDILVLADPRPGAISGMLWERDGLVFVLLTLESPPEGFMLADGVRIVEALIAEQAAR